MKMLFTVEFESGPSIVPERDIVHLNLSDDLKLCSHYLKDREKTQEGCIED